MLARSSTAGAGGGGGSERTMPIVAPTRTAAVAGPNHHGLRAWRSPLASSMITDAKSPLLGKPRAAGVHSVRLDHGASDAPVFARWVWGPSTVRISRLRYWRR